MGGCSSTKVSSQVAASEHQPGPPPKAHKGKELLEKAGAQAPPPCAAFGAAEPEAGPTPAALGTAEPTDLPGSIDAPPLGETAPPPEGPLRLLPLAVSEREVPALLRSYAARLPARVVQTLDCGWQRLSEALDAVAAGACAPEWYWAVEDEEGACAAKAHGLVVYRLSKGYCASSVQVLHVSAAGAHWERNLPAVLEAVSADLFERLPIRGIRASLLYSQEAAGKLALDSTFERIFKEAGFRWFQLTNTADGQRAQVMERRRREGDPPMPEELHDISIRLAAFVPSLAEYSGEAASPSSPDLASLEHGTTASNPLLVAECLRRHSDLVSAESGADPTSQVPKGSVMDVLSTLRKGGDKDIPLFWSKEATDVEECGRLIEESFGGQWASDLSEEAVRRLRSLQGEGSNRSFDSVMCTGASVMRDWGLRHLRTWSPRCLQVPVHAMGTSPKLNVPITYLATEDDAVFVIVWPCSGDESAARNPYAHCCDVLQGATQMPEPLPYEDLAIPRFRVRRFAEAASGLPRSSARILRPPWEAVGAELSSGRPQPGALRPPEREPRRVLTLECPFALCVWHTRLDDLDLPLFATIVVESDCTSQCVVDPHVLEDGGDCEKKTAAMLS